VGYSTQTTAQKTTLTTKTTAIIKYMSFRGRSDDLCQANEFNWKVSDHQRTRPLLKPCFHVKIKLFLKNVSVLFQHETTSEMK